jgi:hypothetical protein
MFVDAGGTGSQDLATPDLTVNTVPGVSFADIEADMEQPTFGCTQPFATCHGTSMPTGIMALQQNGSTNPTVLMANYQSVLKQVDLTTPSQSNLLLNPLVSPGLTHVGGKISDPGMVHYKKWLDWIILGANFGFKPYSDLPTTTADMSVPQDLAGPSDLGDGGK